MILWGCTSLVVPLTTAHTYVHGWSRPDFDFTGWWYMILCGYSIVLLHSLSQSTYYMYSQTIYIHVHTVERQKLGVQQHAECTLKRITERWTIKWWSVREKGRKTRAFGMQVGRTWGGDREGEGHSVHEWGIERGGIYIYMERGETKRFSEWRRERERDESIKILEI